jgi:hypothetical protein
VKRYWETVRTMCKKPVGVAAVSLVRITRADSFGLWPQSVNLKLRFKPITENHRSSLPFPDQSDQPDNDHDHRDDPQNVQSERSDGESQTAIAQTTINSTAIQSSECFTLLNREASMDCAYVLPCSRTVSEQRATRSTWTRTLARRPLVPPVALTFWRFSFGFVPSLCG